MIEPVALLVSILVLATSMITMPSRAACPLRWHNEGVRPTGRYECVPDPVGPSHRDARGILVDDSVQAPGEIVGEITARSGSMPIVVTNRIVGCQR